MFISWFWIGLIVILVLVHINCIKRNSRACRHDRAALQEAYQRLLRRKSAVAEQPTSDESEKTVTKEQ